MVYTRAMTQTAYVYKQNNVTCSTQPNMYRNYFVNHFWRCDAEKEASTFFCSYCIHTHKRQNMQQYFTVVM